MVVFVFCRLQSFSIRGMTVFFSLVPDMTYNVVGRYTLLAQSQY